jgi:raffinose/stachyose/melibiose transport system permease protein
MKLRRQGTYDTDEIAAALLFCAPAVVLLGLFVVWPFIFGFWLSLHRWDGFSPPVWSGLTNYWRLTGDPVFATALRNSIVFVVLTVVFKNALGLAVALLLNSVSFGRAFFRTATFIPVTLSFVAVGLLWAWIYNPVFGLLNAFLDVIGLGGLKRSWLGDADIALYAVVAVDVWKWLGFHAVLYLAGLQTIPADVIDAAKIDGATAWQRLTRITMPLLVPIIFINLVLAFSGAFVRNFDVVYVLTQGGPYHATEVIMTHMVSEAFRNGALTYAAAMGYVLFFITAIISGIMILLMRRSRIEM